MTIKNISLSTDSKSLDISKFRFIAGILMGLLYSFSFYSFSYLVREGFRIMSATENYDLWILTENEVNFYNLFFAFISVIISQSVCLTFWFDKPRKIFEKRNYKKTTILNDQRVLNWYFLSWFSKLAIVFGIMFGLSFHGGFYVFSLYPDYNYVFILIIIVLFFQTWNTIRLAFKRRSLKWMFFSIVIVSIVSLGLSKINLIDYKAINQYYLEKNTPHNYNLELPKTASYERLYSGSLIKNIYVVKSKNDIKTIIVVENNEIDLQQLNKAIFDWQSKLNEYEIHHTIYQLHVDKTIKMDFVNQLKNELSKLGISKIAYAVIPNNPEYDLRYYKDCSIQVRIPNWNSEWINPKNFYNRLNRFQNIIEIKQNTSGKYQINNTPIEANQIKQTIKNLIVKNPDYFIKFHVNDSVEFSDYFIVISHLKEIIDELRNEYSNEHYSTKFDWLDYEESRIIREKFPFRILELTTDFKKMIDRE